MTIPIYFTIGQQVHGSFSKIFDDQNYFKDREIRILHLGAYTGHGTRWMLERVNGTCIDVDVWKNPGDLDSPLNHNDYDAFYTDNNVESLYDDTVSGLPTTKFKGTTAEFFAQNEETFDFIYIDASHRKSDVEFDLEQSWKCLKPEGVIACDDYLWHVEEDPELIPHYAIKEFAEEHEKEIEVLIDGYQFWFKKLAI
jgi:SAM-dependent methyltransferase